MNSTKTPRNPGDVSLSRSDFERIPEYLDSFTEVLYAIRYSSGNTRICVSKKLANGRVLIIETVSKSRGALQFKNAIGVSEEKYQNEILPLYRKRAGTNTRESESSNNTLRDISNSKSIVYGNSSDVNPSRSQRRENLTDRAVLERVDEIVGAVSDSGTVTGDTHGMEVDEVAAFKGKLTEGERDLLEIYTDRLEKLNDIQEQRREQGRIYRRFMADPNPNNRDRGEAAATKNRMDILDQQIDRAANSLREVERAKGYKSLLTKSRELVQQTERGRILTALQLSREKRERSGQRKDSIEAIKKVYSMSPEVEETWEHELKHYADCVAKIGMMLS